MAASRERIQLICEMPGPARGGVFDFCTDLRAALARQSGAAVDLIENKAFGGAGLAVRVRLEAGGTLGAEATLEIGVAEDGRFRPDETRAVTIHSIDGPPLAGAAETIAVEVAAMLARR
jgi:hypothetical protein